MKGISDEIRGCYTKTAQERKEYSSKTYHPICAEGFEQVIDDRETSCYKFEPEKQTWEEAMEYAKKYSGALASIPGKWSITIFYPNSEAFHRT